MRISGLAKINTVDDDDDDCIIIKKNMYTAYTEI